jgi:NADH-quinone oxidoreductase subunit D
MSEMFESLYMLNQLVRKLSIQKKNKINKSELMNYHNFNQYSYITNFTTMEQTIQHFKYWSEGFKLNSGSVYSCVESPKGEFGATLIANSTNKPYRCKVRSPAYHHLQILPKLARGHMLADLVTLMGTIDIVFGEIDR